MGRCIVNVGFFAVTCVGDRSILSVVWSMLVPVNDVGAGSMLGFAKSILNICVKISDLCLVIAWSTVRDFVCAWMNTVGPCLFNVGLGVVSCVG